MKEAPNLKDLQDEMIKGIVATQNALFRQAGKETKRLDRLSNAINSVENVLFDEDFMGQLPAHQKVKLYQLMTNNQGQTLDFLSKLSNNLSTSLEALNHVRKLDKATGTTTDLPLDNFKAQIKSLIDLKGKETIVIDLQSAKKHEDSTDSTEAV